MFRGCRREDMPPHIFAAGQQAYRNMMTTRCDQSLVLMGLSGSGKTFNARYLLRYLATIGQTENAVVTSKNLRVFFKGVKSGHFAPPPPLKMFFLPLSFSQFSLEKL